MMRAATLSLSTALLSLASISEAQTGFVNFETPHVHPLEITPDGARLLAVNTADDRLEVFDLGGAEPVSMGAIPVGSDPVSVRARTATEAWVVNHVSDSVSVVDVRTGRTLATVPTDDEPCDVVFAGVPQRAFVSCSQSNTVLVFDPSDLSLAPATIAINGEDPRALAVGNDGLSVYVAVFESGNGSTILGGGSTLPDSVPPNVVSDPAGPYGGVNPPPNSGASFDPPMKPGNPTPPEVSLIVKKDEQGNWMDDNGGDWTDFVSGAQAAKSARPVGWDLPDRDVAVIDTQTLGVGYVHRLMNMCMALSVHPVDGRIALIGTDATNEIRFEPVLNGVFLRVQLALAEPDDSSTTIVDLNPHLDYSTSTVGQAIRDQSIGDPRGIAWNAAGTRAYITGMGSNNVVVVDATGARAGLAPTIEVGEGPTGIALDEANARLFVLDKFEAAISVVDLATELETARVAFHDASPAAIRDGRQHLYGTHETSGLGHVACGSCHVDARMDRLSWDLGHPGGDVKSVAGQNLAGNNPLLGGGFEDWHPMKGPMLTQTLQDIIGKEPLHWRGDRDGLEEFNAAFMELQGDDVVLTAQEMQEYEDFLATLHFPPNPFRDLDNSLPTDLVMTGHLTTGRFGPAGQPLPNGDAERGLELCLPPNLLDLNALACVTCHTNNTGIGTDNTLDIFSGYSPIPPGPNGERHHMLVQVDEATNVTMKVPQLRNLHERVGFNQFLLENNAGFGFRHDGAVFSIEQFLTESLFEPQNDQDVADLVAFMLAFAGSELPQGSSGSLFEPPGTSSQDAHAAVGVQVRLEDLATATPEELSTLTLLYTLADAGRLGLVAHGMQGGELRGYQYLGLDSWQSDRQAELVSSSQLEAAASIGSELVFTAVPAGTERRVGVDRDADGALDGDERDAASDFADPASTPGGCGDPAPAAPSGLVATAIGDSLASLTWADNSGVETTVRVERSPAGLDAFELVADLPADTTQFLDHGLECATAYDWRVIARGCGGDSAAAVASTTTGACPLLAAAPPAISLGVGGAQQLTLRAGASHGGELYLVLGSATGTAPGLPVDAVLLPLVPDTYFLLTLQLVNSPTFPGSLGALDGAGEGSAAVVLGPNANPNLVGLVLHHAYLTFAGTGQATLASNSTELLLTP